MSTESAPSHPGSGSRVFWLMLGVFLLVGGLLVYGLSVGRGGGGHHSAPDVARPWAEARYGQRFDPSVPRGLALVAGEAKPTLVWSRSGKETVITGSGGAAETPDAWHEIQVADAAGVVTLPDGNRLELSAVAVVLPSDGGGPRDAGSHGPFRPEWIDPRTGAALAATPERPWMGEAVSVSSDTARLLLHVTRTGSLAPLRWHWPQVHDERMRVTTGSMASHSSQEVDGHFWVSLEQGHQAPLRIGIEFAYGQAEEIPLAVEKDRVADYGAGGSVALIGILPGGHQLSSWGGGGGPGLPFKVSFEDRSGGSAGGQRSLIFQVWPKYNQRLVEVLEGGAGRGTLLGGNFGIAFLEQSKEEAQTSEIRLRRYPRLGRAVFELPVVPRLPVVSNLFETPIDGLRVGSEYAYWDLVEAKAGIQVRLARRDLMPKSHFPMVLKATTPARLIADYERLTGQRLHYDRGAFVLTDRAPSSGWSARWRDGWGRLIRRLGL